MSREYFETEGQHKVQLVKELIQIAQELGWAVALPETKDGEEVPGLIMGSVPYVNKVTNCLAKGKFKHE